MAASRYGIERLRQQEMFNNMGGIDLNDPYGGINEPPQQRQIQYQPPPEINDPQGGINVGPEGPDIGSARPSGDIPNLRIQNIAPPEVPMYGEAKQLMDVGNQLFTPSTKRFDEYTRVLDEFPEREDPSFMRRLTASLVGFKGGTEAADKVLFGPYGRDLAEWKAHEEPLRQAATQEGQQNAQERQFTGNIVSNVAANRRVTQQEEAAKAKAETDRFRADTDRMRAITLELKRQNPDLVWDVRGERVRTFNPATGETKDLGPNGLDEATKILLETKGKIAVAEATGAQDRQTQAAPRTAPGAIEPGQPTPVAPRTQENMNPADARLERNQMFAKLDMAHPALRQWFVPPATQNGDWTLADPPTRAGANNPDDWWSSNAEIDAEYARQLSDYNYARKLVGLSPYNPPDAPAPTAPAPAPDPFTPQGQQQSQDPFAQPPVTPGQNLGRLKDVLPDFRAGLRPPAATPQAAAPVDTAPWRTQTPQQPTPQPQPTSPEQAQKEQEQARQVMAEVAAGRRFIVTEKGVPIGTVANDPGEIEYQISLGREIQRR